MPKKKRASQSPLPIWKYASRQKDYHDRIEFYLACISVLCENIYEHLLDSKSQNPVAKTPK